MTPTDNDKTHVNESARMRFDQTVNVYERRRIILCHNKI